MSFITLSQFSLRKKVNPDQNYFLAIHKQKQNRDGYIKFILKLLPHNINSLIEINRNKIKKKKGRSIRGSFIAPTSGKIKPFYIVEFTVRMNRT